MNKHKKTKNRKGFLTLNRQFSLVVIIALVGSFIILLIILSALEPLFYKIYPWVNKQNETVVGIGKEIYKIDDNPMWKIDNPKDIPEIEEIITKYPQYKFKYEFFGGVNRDIFQLKNMYDDTNLDEDYYQTIILEADNGVVLVGFDLPRLKQLSIFITILMLLLYIALLLLFIGIYNGRKVRYLKLITKNLEFIAGGDLSARVPLKGKDEIYLVAYHINEMASALQNEIEKEKGIEEMKRQLITNISHDIRTPLTAILGYLGLLDSMDLEKDRDKLKNYIHRAYEKSNSMSKLVDDLFDFVILSNQQLTYKFELVEPSQYFLQVFTELESIVEIKNLEIDYSLESSIDPIRIDCKHFMRVIENIMQNLQKYAKRDSKVSVNGKRQGINYKLTISNESEENYEEDNKFLERYFTTDRTSGKSAGLGLAICKELVEQQNGSICAKAHENYFTIEITLKCGE